MTPYIANIWVTATSNSATTTMWSNLVQTQTGTTAGPVYLPPFLQAPQVPRSYAIEYGNGQLPHEDVIVMRDGLRITVKSDGLGARIILPNGAEIKVAASGDISLNEQNAKIHYRAAPRDFNKFLNTSDVVEEFIRYLGSLDVRQRHVLTLPLGLFINWLVIAAAEADGDPADDLRPTLVQGVSVLKAQPRCHYCRRFIPRVYQERGVNFCAPAHMERFLARERLRPEPLPRLMPPSATYFERAA